MGKIKTNYEIISDAICWLDLPIQGYRWTVCTCTNKFMIREVFGGNFNINDSDGKNYYDYDFTTVGDSFILDLVSFFGRMKIQSIEIN